MIRSFFTMTFLLTFYLIISSRSRFKLSCYCRLKLDKSLSDYFKALIRNRLLICVCDIDRLFWKLFLISYFIILLLKYDCDLLSRDYNLRSLQTNISLFALNYWKIAFAFITEMILSKYLTMLILFLLIWF